MIRQTLIREGIYHRRRGFWLGVVAGIIIGFGIGAVVMYYSVDQIVIVPLGKGTKL